MKKITVIIALFLSLASCNEWLDIQPELEIRQEKMFETEQGFKDVLSGVYIRMASSSLYGLKTSMVLPEFMAQHWEPETDLGDQLSNFDFTQTLAESLLETSWVQYYQCIINLNSILEKIDDDEDLFRNGGVRQNSGLIEKRLYICKSTKNTNKYNL